MKSAQSTHWSMNIIIIIIISADTGQHEPCKGECCPVWVYTATDLLDIPRQPTCMNPDNYNYEPLLDIPRQMTCMNPAWTCRIV